MFKLTAKTIGPLAAVAALAGLAPGRANADSVTGAIYENSSEAGNATSTPPGSTPTTTFTSSSLNYNETSGNNNNGTIGTFLTPVGSTKTDAPASVAGDNLQGTYFLFTAQVYLSAGSHTLAISHDDGAELTSTGGAGGALTFSNISGGSYSGNSIGYSGPSGTTGPGNNGNQSGLVNVTTAGVYTFKLGYGEVQGLPATLSFTVDGIPAQTTPEPSTVVMAGTAALVGLGCAARRRRKRA